MTRTITDDHRDDLIAALRVADPEAMADPDRDGGEDRLFAVMRAIDLDTHTGDLLEVVSALHSELLGRDPDEEAAGYRLAIGDALTALG